ncbi:MAG: hypothetical protein EAZ97_10180 [Bacteroidetes bacterium]|nr:MAG: hypothetical protein EAZ97_10180 [Bacteroidota bacterium]
MAQSYTFKVIGSKGNISADGKALKVGATLTENQSVVISSGAFLSLLHSNGKPLELKSEGTFKVKDLASKVSGSASLSNKYIDFVQKELTENGGPSAERERKTHMKKTGSVERDIPGPVSLIMPNTRETARYIFGNSITLKYFLKSNSKVFGIDAADLKSFKITIKDMTDEILYEKETTSNTEIVDLTKGKLANAKDLIFKIVPIKKDGSIIDKTDDVMFSRLDEDEHREVASELASITDPKAEPTALSKLIEARFFEEKGYFLDAIVAYEKAVELSYNVDAYGEMYKSFLIRNDMGKEGFEAVALGNK